MKVRKLNRIIHRDFGFFFFGMTIIYALSGIAINHRDDWNPNYIVDSQSAQIESPIIKKNVTEEFALNVLDEFGEREAFKKYFFPRKNKMKIFIHGGSVLIDMKTGNVQLEKISKRPIFHQVNYLHYNPTKSWTIFSDIFTIGLMIIAITGLFIVKGKYGITRVGAVYTIAGILIPLLYLFL